MIFETSGEVNYLVKMSILNVPRRIAVVSWGTMLTTSNALAVVIDALPNVTFLVSDQNSSRGMLSYPVECPSIG